MRLLDLFSGAGGCARGYAMAGFTEIVGVDIKPQKNYLKASIPGCRFHFIQADALKFVETAGHLFDAIHASPPCQRYSVATKSVPGLSESHPDLVDPIRKIVEKVGRPYVIENVIGAPMRRSLVLCGSMFGLLVRRHRVFESSWLILSPGECRHAAFKGNYPCGISNRSKRAGERSRVVHVYGKGCSRGNADLWKTAMQIDWMTMNEMAQSIPPAYTEWIGSQLIAAIENAKD